MGSGGRIQISSPNPERVSEGLTPGVDHLLLSSENTSYSIASYRITMQDMINLESKNVDRTSASNKTTIYLLFSFIVVIWRNYTIHYTILYSQRFESKLRFLFVIQCIHVL